MPVLFGIFPWWTGVVLIILTWVVTMYGLPALLYLMAQWVPSEVAKIVLSDLSSILPNLSPIFTALAGLWWLVIMVDRVRDRKLLDKQTGLGSIRRLSWEDFERLLAEAYRRLGYSVKLTPEGADGGVDLVLVKDGRKSVVQAKRWRTYKVGVDKVRELYGVQSAMGVDSSIMVTCGRATTDARRFARHTGMTLIEGRELVAMIRSVQRSVAAGEDQRSSAKVEESRLLAAATGGTGMEADLADDAHIPLTATPGPAVAAPLCPRCGILMVQRTARRGANAGGKFWGCPRYPDCPGIRQMS
ncbi:MAG: restriction endonuclease [Phycisphaeraceae bacterium]|nr:restriction endonuclease [Phycisphaeraceae bacterium]